MSSLVPSSVPHSSFAEIDEAAEFILKDPKMGQLLEVKDSFGKWYAAQIVDVRANSVDITFSGWEEDNNETVLIDNRTRFRPHRYVPSRRLLIILLSSASHQLYCRPWSSKGIKVHC